MNVEYAFFAACKFSRFIGRGRIAVGMDTRISSRALLLAASSGAMYSGCNVLNLGYTTTPELFYFTKKMNLEGGVMVTASHNPQEWNGLKFVIKARGIFEEELKSILSKECVPANEDMGKVSEGDSTFYYHDLSQLMGHVPKGLAIALDLGGGSGCFHIPSFFKRSGADVYAINASPGIFGRNIDPTADDLKELIRMMKVTKCNVGFAFDCDGDRLQVVDPAAGKLPPDFTLYLAVKNAKNVSKVALSVDTSDMVIKEAKKRGMSVILAPVGEANVVKTMLDKGCQLGGEGSSAGVIDSNFSYCRDGLVASSYVINELIRNGSLQMDELAGHHIKRVKFHLDKRASEIVMKALEKEYPDALKIDGIKVRFEDGWFLVRRSRTEDVLRVSVEGESKQAVERLLKEISAKVEGLAKGAL
jgi:phosphomannomutase